MEGKGMDQEAPSARPPPLEDQGFAIWARILGHPRAKLPAKDPRRKLLSERFAEGMTLEETEEVCRGAIIDAKTWPDRQRFDGIEYLFESRASVEKFADLARRNEPAPTIVEAPIQAPTEEPWRAAWLELKARGIGADRLRLLAQLRQVSDGAELRLAGPDARTCDWLAENMRGALDDAAGKPVRLEVAA